MKPTASKSIYLWSHTSHSGGARVVERASLCSQIYSLLVILLLRPSASACGLFICRILLPTVMSTVSLCFCRYFRNKLLHTLSPIVAVQLLSISCRMQFRSMLLMFPRSILPPNDNGYVETHVNGFGLKYAGI